MLARDELLVSYRAELEGAPAFLVLWRGAYDPPLPVPTHSALSSYAPGTLGSVYLGFLRHYRLDARFFPLDAAHRAADPLGYLLQRLDKCHDLVHVLGGYETCDDDEVAIQSFMLGQSPLAVAGFFAAVQAAEALGVVRYKHLRHVIDAAISLSDVARGRDCVPLVYQPLEDLLHEPLDALRARFRLPSRAGVTRALCHNTCGGYAERPYFTA